MGLVTALEASGLVGVVGAGGKKSTMYALANRIERAVVTSTVLMPSFEEEVAEFVVTEAPDRAVREASEWPVGVVPELDRPDRHRGYATETVAPLVNVDPQLDAVLVKADGARTRDLKAPGDREPQLPTTVDTVLPVASVAVVGEPLTEEYVHRVERVTALTGRQVGETVRPADVATVVTHETGGMKAVPPDTTVVPVLNKVDDDDLAATAREVADEIHARADVPRVALTSHDRQDGPLVDVVPG